MTVWTVCSDATRKAKAKVREERSVSRRRVRAQPEHKALLDDAIVHATLACMDHFGAVGHNVAAYAPLPSEPGPADYPARLADHARAVWLPISLPAGRLAWAQFDGAGSPGALGITEPGGARFTSGVLGSCALILAPALAVDRTGMRLGKGAGYYDRALRGREVPVAAVVYDEDVVDDVPHGAHDVAVDAVITPAGFFCC